MTKHEGNILKLKSELTSPISYSLPMGDELVHLNPLIGKKIKLSFDGTINCIDSGEVIKKTYNQGYSYKSFMKKAACDICIVKPELCHYSEGTCREPKWGEDHCLKPHIVYLSVSSHLKIGITRQTQIPTRFIDQGASYALPIFRVKDRLSSGLLEREIKKTMSDKTNWRKMLQNDIDEDIDLYEVRDQIFEDFEDLIDELDAEDLDEDLINLDFPVNEYPEKIKSLGFDKLPIIEGELKGIKGQYLILDCGVLNMRKHQGYRLSLEY